MHLLHFISHILIIIRFIYKSPFPSSRMLYKGNGSDTCKVRHICKYHTDNQIRHKKNQKGNSWHVTQEIQHKLLEWGGVETLVEKYFIIHFYSYYLLHSSSFNNHLSFYSTSLRLLPTSLHLCIYLVGFDIFRSNKLLTGRDLVKLDSNFGSIWSASHTQMLDLSNDRFMSAGRISF